MVSEEDAQKQAEATLRAAQISAKAAKAAAIFAALGAVLSVYANWESEARGLEHEFLLHAASGETVDAYCNVKLWKEAKLIRPQIADDVINAFVDQRPKASNSKSCDH